MRVSRSAALVVSVLGLALGLAGCGSDAPPPPPPEHTGAFAFDDGTRIAFAARDDGCLRAVLDDGWVARVCPDADASDTYSGGSYFGGAGPETVQAAFSGDRVEVARGGRAPRAGARMPAVRTPVTFTADGLTFNAELIAPPGDQPAPLLVHIGGSERTGAVNRVWMPHHLAAAGVASFVYDKRGVGGSDGRYTQDFSVLGADAVAAVKAARDAMGDRLGAVAVIGFSQGGWIGPIAAQTADVDGVLVAFGLAVSPAAEEISEVSGQLAAAGHGPEVIARGAALAEAAVRVADSDFAQGVADFRDLKQAARDEGWLTDLNPANLTGVLAQRPVFAVRSVWRFFDVNTSWTYDPRDTIAQTAAPQLWLLGGRDRAAPSEETQAVLRELSRAGADIEVQVFPTADHGLVEREGGRDGPATRYTDGYLKAVIDFALQLDPAE